MVNLARPIVSKKFQLRSQDVGKALSNAKMFSAPLIVIYLAFAVANVQDGVAVADFVPSNAVLTAGALYILNFLLDISRKWAGENRY